MSHELEKAIFFFGEGLIRTLASEVRAPFTGAAEPHPPLPSRSVDPVCPPTQLPEHEVEGVLQIFPAVILAPDCHRRWLIFIQ